MEASARDVEVDVVKNIRIRQLLGLALFGMVLIAMTVHLAVTVPWLGLTGEYDQSAQGWRVSSVSGPARGVLSVGDVVVKISADGLPPLSINHESMAADPAVLPDYAAYNRFFAWQLDAWLILNHQRVLLHLRGGDTRAIHPDPLRPAWTLGAGFWAMMLCAYAGYLVAITIWALRRSQVETRILAVAGVGFMLGSLSAAVYVSRELALDSGLFYTLSSLNHLGLFLFAASILALFWNYPLRLGSFPATTMIYGLAAVVWLNEIWQLFAWPWHVFYLHYLLVFAVLLMLCYRQWRVCSTDLVNRLSLYWLLFSILISLGLVLLLYFVPIIYGEPPLMSVAMSATIGLVLFIGLAFGVVRYRLFSIERWWLNAWFWLLGGLLIMLVDITLIYWLNFSTTLAMALAVILTGWVYFPLRQWVLMRYAGGQANLVKHFPLLIDTLFAADNDDDDDRRWTSIVSKIFSPLALRRASVKIERSYMDRYGLTLYVPSMGSGNGYLLSYKHAGDHLYSPDDVSLAESLYELNRYAIQIRQARERGAVEERRRIMRDLHDDVASKLLTLIHRSPGEQYRRTAQSALNALRETIYTLDKAADICLADTLDAILADAYERLSAASIRLLDDWPAHPPHRRVSPRLHVNLQRICQEAITNIINHAEATEVSMSWSIDADRQVLLTLCDNGVSTANVNDWSLGKGVNNIRTRVAELGGEVEWLAGESAHGVCVRVTFRLEDESGGC